MPLNAGSVSVTAGIASGSGLSKELFDALRSAQGIAQTPDNNTALTEMGKFAKTIATVVIAHIKANALVSTDDTGTVAADIPVATAGSSTAQTGATTATGAVTAKGTGTIA